MDFTFQFHLVTLLKKLLIGLLRMIGVNSNHVII